MQWDTPPLPSAITSLTLASPGLKHEQHSRIFRLSAPTCATKIPGAVPIDSGVQPYTVVERNGVRIGIIGLTTTTTPQTTAPYNVEPFDFIDYETALREIVPQIQAEDIDLIVVPAHLCERELVQLVPSAVELGVHLLGGGHCNEPVADSAESLSRLSAAAICAATPGLT